MTDTILVRGLESCGGDWGHLHAGDEKALPRDIAESLMRAGYAEPVEQSAEVEKKEEPKPRRKSKTA